jgi:3-hydroxyisobutyrate dehydrogenase-like beta-hydroxyacid dehydrogenase
VDHRPPPESNQKDGSPVGLVGVGLLGLAIAERLRGAGHDVLAWDREPGRVESLAALGGRPACGLDDVFASCRRVVLCLPTHEVVADVLRSAGPDLRAGQCVIDTSTGTPEAAIEQSERLAPQGVNYLDATVSGSSEQMRRGQAILLVGATETGFFSCLDLFSCLGAQTIHAGEVGSGSRAKLVTNLVLGLNRAALAEGLVFADSLGLGPALALEVLRAGASYSRIMDAKGPKMIASDFAPQARLSQHLKDVRLILDLARDAGRKLPLSEAHRALLESAVASGWGDLDNSAIIEALRGSGHDE